MWRDGELVDQKETPLIASIAARLDTASHTLILSHRERGEFRHTLRSHGTARPAKWVLDEFSTIDQGDDVANWLTDILGMEVRLVAPGDPWKINFPIPQMELLHGEEKQSFFAASSPGAWRGAP